MKFIMFIKSNSEAEAGVMPSEELIAAMGRYNEQLIAAGVLVDLAGLQSSAKGARIRMSPGKRTVIDGPFANPEHMVAGYWIINVNSREEAIEWARRVPDPPPGEAGGAEGEIELRQIFELSDFAPSPAVEIHHEIARTLGKE